jgi:hypothetical protein
MEEEEMLQEAARRVIGLGLAGQATHLLQLAREGRFSPDSHVHKDLYRMAWQSRYDRLFI